jgi:hypothetical protein
LVARSSCRRRVHKGGWRPVALADQAITLTQAGSLQKIAEEATAPRDVDGLDGVSGPGLPFSHKKYDATFLDGAIALIIAKQP